MPAHRQPLLQRGMLPLLFAVLEAARWPWGMPHHRAPTPQTSSRHRQACHSLTRLRLAWDRRRLPRGRAWSCSGARVRGDHRARSGG
eukprot:scaffold43853_cov59-Phaeocystis_antarctica.AAC.3